tara:strand:- start:181 stop:552 length:372 start_codon:yes stop_codon:yes gene_type:complete
MPDRINFTQEINSSAQVGDTLYWSRVSAANQDVIVDGPIEVGPITRVGRNFLEVPTGSAPPNLTEAEIQADPLFAGPLFMFRKNGQSNISTLVGYFAEIELTLNATDRRELFGIGSEIFVSSK